MNINHYALRKEREIQKFINKLPPLNAAAAGVGNDKRITHHILTGYHNNHLPISVFVPKHKEDGEKFPVIIDIYGGGFVAGRSEQNKCFGAWCGTPKSRWTEVVALKFLGLKISKTSVVCSEKHIVKYICRLSRLSISMMSHTTRTFWTSI